jgi:hypothetical protein
LSVVTRTVRGDGANGVPRSVEEAAMIIDCDRCRMRDIACADCVVSVLLGPPGAAVEGFDSEERAALGVLADSGLVPPLRLTLAAEAGGDQWRSVI